jgi:hypothetical protein
MKDLLLAKEHNITPTVKTSVQIVQGVVGDLAKLPKKKASGKQGAEK